MKQLAASAPTASPLRVHIDTLAVPASSTARGQRLGAAMVRELDRILSAPELLAQLRAAAESRSAGGAPVLHAHSVAWRLEDGPERIGRSVAASVAGSLLALADAPRSGVRR